MSDGFFDRLQQALIVDETSRERIKTICQMIKKKFGRSIPQAKVGRLIKRVFPNVIIKLKGSIYGVIWGVRIDISYHPASAWLQKAISWYSHFSSIFFLELVMLLHPLFPM